jgi:cytochrome P450
MTMQYTAPGTFEAPKVEKYDFPKVPGRDLAHIPGRKGLPWFGILPEAVSDPYRFTRNMYDRYGPIHRFYAYGSWNLQIVGPEANEFALFDQAGNFSCAGGWDPVFGRHFQGGLMLRDGGDHSRHRKLLAAAFKQSHLEGYARNFDRVIRDDQPQWRDGVIEAYGSAQRLGFKIGYSSFLGRPENDAEAMDLWSFRTMMRTSTSVVPIPLPGNNEWRAAKAHRHIHRLIGSALADPLTVERTDLLANLLRQQDEQGLTREEIVSHVIFVIAASYDALSSGMTSMLYELARNPEWQAPIREELLAIIKGPEDVTLANLGKWQLADRAFREALRLHAAAPVLWRRAIRDCEFKGVRIPAGTFTGINPMLTHLLPEIWGDEPERFNPDHFLPDRVRTRHRFAYVPFGGGAHACLGMNYAGLEAKMLLRHLLDGHRIELAQDHEPKFYHWPNAKPIGGLKLRIAPLAG